MKQTLNRLRLQIGVFWLIPLLLAALYGGDYLETGRWADDEGARYVAGTWVVMLTIFCVPAALKGFSLYVKRYAQGRPAALSLYERAFAARLLALSLCIWPGVYVYFQTFDNLGGLCALIGLTASLFCIPREARIRQELHLDEE
ncbi:MAG: hypothetical protein LBM61_03230 [Prevotellaceae bacterium]|jgi:hypothetical protein|nr:hypothetical protein [Prevotellaceae bacterium]